MLIALWIVNALLALASLAAGAMKVIRAKPQLKAAGMHWTDDFAAPSIKGIGALEVVGALGLILPLATGVLPILTPLAATGLAVIFVGAVVTHLRRRESPAPSAVLAILSVVSAVLGFLVVLG